MILTIAFMMSFMTALCGITFSFDSRCAVNPTVRTKIERNITDLLNEVHKASVNNRDLNLNNINMEPAAKEHLMNFWEYLPFDCEDMVIVTRCLEDYQGYQVRGIKIELKPKDDTYKDRLNRELTISLNKSGIITGARPALELQEDVASIMKEGKDVTDLVRRREILKWVEDFRNYYNEKNIESLENIYSDDALIITGSVVNKKKITDTGVQIISQVKYSEQSKPQYIKKLKNIFKNNRYIDVKFEKITVVNHNTKPNIYGVTLKQTWKTSSYSDEGWLFLLWDFDDPEHPQIHVRTWQPDEVIAKDGIFTLDDFFLP